MDSTSIGMTVALVILVAMSAYFSATETAFTSLNRIRLKSRADNGDQRAARALALAEDYDKLLSTILIGNNIVNNVATTIGAVLFIRLLDDVRGPTVSAIVLTVVILIFGEVSPKSLAKESPEAWAMLSAPLLRAFVAVLTPANFLFTQWKRLLSLIIHKREEDGITEEELVTMVDQAENEGGLDEHESELIRNAIAHIDEKLFVSELQYTTTIGRQKTEMNEYEIERGASFTGEKTRTQTLKHAETSQIKYDLIGKIAEGTVLTRRTVSAILQGIRVDKLYMFRNNPEEFITKVIRLINEQKATMIVEHISYDTIEGEYDSSIFTAEKATQSFDKAFLAKKAIQDYVFTDGSADKSIERKFAEDLDAADEVCVYAKLPRTFQIPTPIGYYSPDWAIAFYEGKVKHIFFIAETKGTMESLELRPIEQAKISCAKKLFNEMSTSNVVYHDVDSYQSLLNIMNSL